MLLTAPFYFCHQRFKSLHSALCLEAESRILAGQVSSAKRECSRLERDLEEGSRRLAMAHTEIRHLTDELESAHLTQRAYGERYLTVVFFGRVLSVVQLQYAGLEPLLNI